MFSYEVRREFSIVSLVLQLLVAYCGPLVVATILTSSIVRDTIASQILTYILVGITAACFALLVSTIHGDAAFEGRRIWIPPVLVEGAMVIWEMASNGFMSVWFGLVLFAEGPLGGEASLAVVLLTLPTWSCCWYSAAMWWRRRRRRQAAQFSG